MPLSMHRYHIRSTVADAKWKHKGQTPLSVPRLHIPADGGAQASSCTRDSSCQRGSCCGTCLDTVIRSMVADAKWKLKRQMPLGVPR